MGKVDNAYDIVVPIVIFSNLGFRIDDFEEDEEYSISVPEHYNISQNIINIYNQYLYKYCKQDYRDLNTLMQDYRLFCYEISNVYTRNINYRRTVNGEKPMDNIRFIAAYRPGEVWTMDNVLADIDFMTPIVESFKTYNDPECVFIDDCELISDYGDDYYDDGEDDGDNYDI
jgi:hypothetical protein